jgi:hypothetical protein
LSNHKTYCRGKLPSRNIPPSLTNLNLYGKPVLR